MSSVIERRINEIDTLLRECMGHPMAFDLKECKNYYTVLFPVTVKGISGIRVEKLGGKVRALKILLDKLEHYWKLDNPALYPNYGVY